MAILTFIRRNELVKFFSLVFAFLVSLLSFIFYRSNVGGGGGGRGG